MADILFLMGTEASVIAIEALGAREAIVHALERFIRLDPSASVVLVDTLSRRNLAEDHGVNGGLFLFGEDGVGFQCGNFSRKWAMMGLRIRSALFTMGSHNVISTRSNISSAIFD